MIKSWLGAHFFFEKESLMDNNNLLYTSSGKSKINIVIKHADKKKSVLQSTDQQIDRKRFH